MEQRFARDLAALDDMFGFIDAFVNAEDARPVAFPLNLALEELFVNMVRHNAHGAGDIHITLERDGGRLLVTISDADADYFDLTRHAPVDVNAPLAERTPGGLGIYLVQRLMDEVHYEYRDRNARVTLVKQLP